LTVHAETGVRGARSKARKAALDLLFASEAQGTDAVDLLEAAIADPERTVRDYTIEIVRGVSAEIERIDGLISDYSDGWPLDRMPAVDRNVLRLGTWEMLWSDVPGPVVLSEAVALVRDLSTDESPVFVNGVLGSIEREHAPRG
jgi:N utilization substance protein B